jgi:16S rRNA (guanine966-N2)-methyltransferase
VRPTAEGVRDRWLELLEADLAGIRVLDLFAGSGAIGLEALSRGARYVDFVENGAGALHSLKANVAALRVTKKCKVFKQDVIPFVAKLKAGAYDVCFADPPYGSGKLDLVIERWREVAFAGVLTIEHSKDHDIPMKGKSYDFEGDTRVTVLRR